MLGCINKQDAYTKYDLKYFKADDIETREVLIKYTGSDRGIARQLEIDYTKVGTVPTTTTTDTTTTTTTNGSLKLSETDTGDNEDMTIIVDIGESSGEGSGEFSGEGIPKEEEFSGDSADGDSVECCESILVSGTFIDPNNTELGQIYTYNGTMVNDRPLYYGDDRQS